MNRDKALQWQIALLLLGIITGFGIHYMYGIIFNGFSLFFGFWAFFLPNKKGPGLREIYNKWYHGSSIEKYQKVTAYGKGDYAGYWYMGFVAFCFFTIVTIFPLAAFWSLMAWFNPIITQNLGLIVGLSCYISLPQFIYLWMTAFNDYLKKTGKLKSK